MCPFQQSLGNLLSPTYRDNTLRARSEVERRGKYIATMETKIGSDHPLIKLVKQCLDNEPHDRPSAQELLTRLRKLEFGDSTSLYAVEVLHLVV